MLAGCLLVAGCSQAPPRPRITLLPPDLVLVSRVGGADVLPHSAGCPLQTLAQTPATIFRDLGSIELAGSVPAGKDVLLAVDQQACASGADAIVVKQREERLTGEVVEYHVTAEALLLYRPKPTPSPVAESSASDDGSAPSLSPSAEDSEHSAGAFAPPETLMQPVAPNEAGQAMTPPSAAAPASMTEAPIAPTEASPLSQPAPAVPPVPAPSPALTASATPTEAPPATPSATPSPAPPEPTPTSSATPTPSSEAPTPQSSMIVTPTESTTPSPALTASATPIEAPSATPSATPSPAPAEPTPTSSATPTASSEASMPQPSTTVTPAEAPTRLPGD